MIIINVRTHLLILGRGCTSLAVTGACSCMDESAVTPVTVALGADLPPLGSILRTNVIAITLLLRASSSLLIFYCSHLYMSGILTIISARQHIMLWRAICYRPSVRLSVRLSV